MPAGILATYTWLIDSHQTPCLSKFGFSANFRRLGESQGQKYSQPLLGPVSARPKCPNVKRQVAQVGKRFGGCKWYDVMGEAHEADFQSCCELFLHPFVNALLLDPSALGLKIC